MRKWRLFIVAPAVVLLSALVAYGIVFWTPWFGARSDYGFSYFTPDTLHPEYIDTFYPYAPEVQELAKLQPGQFQAVVQSLFDELLELSEAELYMLSAAGEDLCLSLLIECRGVPGKNVKPFVEKALAHKQAREMLAISAGGLNTARLSLAVAFCAFIVSVAGLFLRRR